MLLYLIYFSRVDDLKLWGWGTLQVLGLFPVGVNVANTVICKGNASMNGSAMKYL